MPLAAAREALEGARSDMRELTEQVRTLVQALAEHQSGSTTQTVIHKSDGAGTLVGICVACVIVMLAMIVIENRSFAAIGRSIEANKKEMQDELRDVKAWNEVLRGKVATLEAKQPKP